MKTHRAGWFLLHPWQGIIGTMTICHGPASFRGRRVDGDVQEGRGFLATFPLDPWHSYCTKNLLWRCPNEGVEPTHGNRGRDPHRTIRRYHYCRHTHRLWPAIVLGAYPTLKHERRDPAGHVRDQGSSKTGGN